MGMNDGHIMLKKTDTHCQLDPKQLMKQFKNEGFPDFEHLHQRFAQEFANKIFDGHLKSYQRAFMPVTPQDLGLMDFCNIRSRRRAVFGGNKLGRKPFIDKQSSLDITNETRNKAIAKFMAQTELLNKKRIKKSNGKDPKKKKKGKSPVTSSFTDQSLSDSSSYSLSIAVDVPLSASHRSTSSIHCPSQLLYYSDH